MTWSAHFEGFVELGCSVHFPAELQGARDPAVISGVDVEVLLPSFEPSESLARFKCRYPKDFVASWTKYFEHLHEKEPWGYGLGTVGTRLTLFSASRLGLYGPGGPDEENAQTVLHEAARFSSAVKSWVSVLSARDLDPSGFELEQHAATASIWLQDAPEGRQLFCPHPTQLTVTLPSAHVASHDEWRAILAQASKSSLPPDAHLFLAEARKMHNQRVPRRAVLDAATATEIALTKLLDDLLVGTPERVADVLREKCRMLATLTEVCRRFYPTLPPSIVAAVAEPRNRAIPPRTRTQ